MAERIFGWKFVSNRFDDDFLLNFNLREVGGGRRVKWKIESVDRSEGYWSFVDQIKTLHDHVKSTLYHIIDVI
jgi:hypothetical protein